MSQMKEQDKIIAGDISKTEISNMTDREFKVIIIKILKGLEKRVEDISETLNKEIKNNISKMKNSISEIKNTIDGINSRLQKVKECVSVI